LTRQYKVLWYESNCRSEC